MKHGCSTASHCFIGDSECRQLVTITMDSFQSHSRHPNLLWAAPLMFPSSPAPPLHLPWTPLQRQCHRELLTSLTALLLTVTSFSPANGDKQRISVGHVHLHAAARASHLSERHNVCRWKRVLRQLPYFGLLLVCSALQHFYSVAIRTSLGF